MNQRSKLGEVWENPIGRNALINLDRYLQKNDYPSITRFSKKTPIFKLDTIAGEGFSEKLVALMNQQGEQYKPQEKEYATPTWWKESVIYQVYLPSFMDADHDGLGDFSGVIQRLPYLEKLGVNTLWLTPFIYSGTKNDYGAYDFKMPYPDFGDLDDFESLMQAAHMHDMRVVIGLDIGSTSEEHPWFKKALADPTSKWYQYYDFRKGSEDTPPNNWGRNSKGWKWYPQVQAWALRLLGGNRMELNWENPEVRNEMAEVLTFWMEKGVDGFCLASFSAIAKSDFSDGMACFASSAGVIGYEHCAYNPMVHTYLKELRRNIKSEKEPLLIGSTAGMTPLFAGLFTQENTGELDMILDLSHLLGRTGMISREDQDQISLYSLKQYYLNWMHGYNSSDWMSLVLGNSKLPRIVSRIGVSSVYRSIAAKLLGTMQFTMRGTPVVYQGEELGLPNLYTDEMDELDSSVFDNIYSIQQAFLKDGFDYARAPMPWIAGPKGGFTGAEPWMKLMDGIDYLNANTQMENSKSVLSYYRRLISLHKQSRALLYGDFKPVFVRNKRLFCYFRILDSEKWYVEMNLTDKVVRREGGLSQSHKLMLSNYDQGARKLRPYEANIYRCD